MRGDNKDFCWMFYYLFSSRLFVSFGLYIFCSRQINDIVDLYEERSLFSTNLNGIMRFGFRNLD